ncbi:MAG TPA: biotin/lipoyl-containing protein [Dehalococcoidia bacterium]|nr:biotin/lipoyl-containing protein [Dehalococcoidia bacterium]
MEDVRTGSSPEPLRRWLLAKYFLRLGDREVEAEIEETPDGLRVNLDGTWRAVNVQRLGDGPRYVLVLDDRLLEVLVAEEAQAFNVQIAGRTYEVETVRRRGRGTGGDSDQFVDGRWQLRAPLTGVAVEVRVAPGATVAQGDVLIVIEAMKMLNELKSRVAGTVALVPVEQGQRVEIGTVIAEIVETA